MLEAFLFTYRNQFGEEFPLEHYEGKTELEVVDIIIGCLQTNKPIRLPWMQ